MRDAQLQAVFDRLTGQKSGSTAPTAVASSGLGKYGTLNATHTAPVGVSTNVSNAGGLGSYGTYNGVGVNEDAFNAMYGTDHGGTLTQNLNTQNSNTPSTMENVLGYTTAAVGLGGLAGSLYFNQKNLDMQNDWNDYQKNRNAQADARKSSFASKVGGSY